MRTVSESIVINVAFSLVHTRKVLKSVRGPLTLNRILVGIISQFASQVLNLLQTLLSVGCTSAGIVQKNSKRKNNTGTCDNIK